MKLRNCRTNDMSRLFRPTLSPVVFKDILLYCFTSLASLIILLSVCECHNKSWSVPFWGPLAGDSLFHAALVKSVIQNGWYLFNPYIGAPANSPLYDFYYAPTLHIAGIKILSVFTRNFGVLFNVYFALTFPLSTLSAIFAFRSFGVARLPAASTAILFSFLPFHLLRGQLHLPYAAYFMVPLGCTVALSIWDIPWTSRTYVLAILVCVVLSFDLPYWPFFTAFAISVAGLCAAFSNRSMLPAATADLLVAAIAIASVVNLIPNILYRWQHGSNPEALVRVPQEAEIYGLKIAQLMLPVVNHRFAPFQKVREGYDATAPLVNENSTATLGLVAGIGFCFLILVTFIDIDLCNRWPVLPRLAKLNLACLLLGTVGGFASLLSFTIFDKIRCYNRVSILIGLFALFAVAIILTEVCGRLPGWAACTLCAAVVAFGLWDQTPPRYDFNAVNSARMANDGAFIKQIERRVPKQAMIFELPYQPYPEGGSVNRMQDYEPLSPYLYSEYLRWSAGAIKGRAEDARERRIASSSAPEMLGALVLRGFRGVYIDRDGYTDNARALETELASLLREQPMTSRDGRLSFFDLAPFRPQFQESVETTRCKGLVENLLSLMAVWTHCYDSGGNSANSDHWCRGRAELEVLNPFNRSLPLAIEMRLTALGQPVAKFALDGPSVHRQLLISNSGTSLQLEFDAPPGIQVMHARCDGAAINARNDPRLMVFSVQEFRLDLKTDCGAL